jgi:RES domain-containing protein
MLVYRLNQEKYKDDISGYGAFLNGGRWNEKEQYLLYTATSRSLALLEALVHLKQSSNIIKWYILTIEMPDLPTISSVIKFEKLPKDWAVNESVTKYIGSKFILDKQLLFMEVPSIIIPEENNVIINPKHQYFNKVKIKQNKLLRLDKRLV